MTKAITITKQDTTVKIQALFIPIQELTRVDDSTIFFELVDRKIPMRTLTSRNEQ